MQSISLSEIEGFEIGMAQDDKGGSGCTVIIYPTGATGGVDVRGGSPGTRETDLLDPVNLVEKIHAVVLSGGSAFGLDAAAGVMEYLEEKNCGFDVGIGRVPIVSGAVLFDLGVGDFKKRPDREMGYQACQHIYREKIPNGNFGAGLGATVGKYLGMERAMKGGQGIYACQVGRLKVGAVAAVNCFGDVINPENGSVIAGALKENGQEVINSEKELIACLQQGDTAFGGNTTIAAVLTNAKISKSQANKIASIAHDGYARTMRPSHSLVDGDTIFTMAAGEVEVNINLLGMLAAVVIEKAVLNAVKNAESLFGFKSYTDIG
ncbi:MAG: P1 family peptidase [Firmicutes bacterium]|nr:P1 family peptidase [Bacillota bacterium]